MNKWIFRLTGLLVVALITLLFLDHWLHPEIPDYIERSVDLRGEQPGQSAVQADAPPLILTSQEDRSQPAVAQTTGQTPGAEPTLTLTSQEAPETPLLLHNPDAAHANTWIQAGSFGERTNADKRAAVLRAQGWSVEIEPATVNGKHYHRVYIGPLMRGQLGGYLDKLKAMNIAAKEVNR